MTNLELQTALANMFAAETTAALLTQDLNDIKSWIHEALLECYSPVPPHNQRGDWTVRYHADILKAPVTVSLALTNGSTAMVVTGVAMEVKYAGSFIQIGDAWYRYAGKVTTVDHLLQPWSGATGTYSATVYYNAVALPANCAKVIERPSLLGAGELWPMPGPAAEIAIRSEPAYDFGAFRNRLSPSMRRMRFSDVLTQDTGDPVFYHVDSGSVSPTFATTKRFHVFPLPDRVCTIDARIHIIPARLTTDEAVPPLPGDSDTVDMVSSILLPLARERLALNANGRRFTGDVKGLQEAAKTARQQLSKLARPQRDTGEVIRTAPGW